LKCPSVNATGNYIAILLLLCFLGSGQHKAMPGRFEKNGSEFKQPAGVRIAAFCYHNVCSQYVQRYQAYNIKQF